MYLSKDQNLQFGFVNTKCIVVVFKHKTANKPLLFTHTAHQASRKKFFWIKKNLNFLWIKNFLRGEGLDTPLIQVKLWLIVDWIYF